MTATTDAPTSPASPPQAVERTFTQWDGSKMFYRAWLPATLSSPSQPSGKALLLFHRGHEHSGRFEDVVAALDLKDVSIFAWDARGHGRTEGPRGYAPSFAHVVKDMEMFARHISREYSIDMRNMAVLAHSVGAVAAAAWVHDYAPPIRSLVLVTPALRVKLYVPLALPGLRMMRWMKGDRPSFIKSYVKAKMLTHDPAQAARYDSDPLIARSIAVNILLDMHDTATRLIKDAGAITTPTLLLGAGKDWVVDLDAQRRFFEHLSSADKEMHTFPGMFHDLLHEADRAPVIDAIRTFIQRTFETRRPGEDLHEADKHGYTQREYDDLQCALPLMSPKRWSFAAQRLMMKSLGRLSSGIRLGWATGFDSGKSLDYVYENQPRGNAIIGKMIDRTYLNSPGWRGIRQRKRHIEILLQAAIRDTVRADRPVRLLDIAAGAGRYVLETMKALPDTHIDGHLRDHDPANVETARRLAKELGVTSVIFEKADAFDEESLAAIAPAPTIVIVSGLYELFPGNELIARSLRGIARAMREGGWLIYTAQPWHPQLEMIARVLINRDGKPWIMRRRTQEEMDELVHTAGFRKEWMEIDEAGIFTVSLARFEARS